MALKAGSLDSSFVSVTCPTGTMSEDRLMDEQ